MPAPFAFLVPCKIDAGTMGHLAGNYKIFRLVSQTCKFRIFE